jgi:hypothetical protein
LIGGQSVKNWAYGTMFSAICEANFPTPVPPYFCTSHLASGTIVFWCKFGGVLGGGDESTEDSEGVDAAEEVGVDGSDILLHAVEDSITIKGVFGTFSSQAKARVVRKCGGLDGAMKKMHS